MQDSRWATSSGSARNEVSQVSHSQMGPDNQITQYSYFFFPSNCLHLSEILTSSRKPANRMISSTTTLPQLQNQSPSPFLPSHPAHPTLNNAVTEVTLRRVAEEEEIILVPPRLANLQQPQSPPPQNPQHQTRPPKHLHSQTLYLQ